MENIDITFLGAFGALAGGFLGAAFGVIIAFFFCGLAVVAGICIIASGGDAGFLNIVAFGEVFGPHVSFVAGVTAAAYAKKKGLLESGRDILTPLITLKSSSVLIVGSLTGLSGYILYEVISAIPIIGSHTDAIALTIVILAILTRLLYGKTGIIGANIDGKVGKDRFIPCVKHSWVLFQDGWRITSLTGFFVGGLSAYVAYNLLTVYPDSPAVVFIGFGVSAMSLIAYGMNQFVPITHHITLIGGVAILRFSPLIHDGFTLVIVGAIMGLVVALLAQIFSRFWLIRGDTHIDPPASAVWIATSLCIVLSIVFG